MVASLKLIDLVEQHAEQIATQWSRVVVKNPFTPFYHDKPAEKPVPRCILLLPVRKVICIFSAVVIVGSGDITNNEVNKCLWKERESERVPSSWPSR